MKGARRALIRPLLCNAPVSRRLCVMPDVLPGIHAVVISAPATQLHRVDARDKRRHDAEGAVAGSEWRAATANMAL